MFTPRLQPSPKCVRLLSTGWFLPVPAAGSLPFEYQRHPGWHQLRHRWFCNPITTYPGPAALSAGLSTSVVNYPNYSYNIQNVAHEVGHVLGLRHTHACVWNGNNSQIDDCGNVIANNGNKTAEGNNCFTPSSPILPGANGTIMSFATTSLVRLLILQRALVLLQANNSSSIL